MTIQTLCIDELHLIVGGADAPAAQPPSARSADEDRIRQTIRDEINEQYEMREKERFREWERSHPFSAFICQGDRSCMR